MNTYEDRYNLSTIHLSHRQLGTKMADFTIEELMIFCVSLCGALGIFASTMMKSKCSSCCWGLIQRDVNAVIESERISAGTAHDSPPEEPEPELNP